MYKKIFIIFTLSIFLFLSLYPKNAAQAAAPLIRIGAGLAAENALEGIADKVGIHYGTQRELDLARQRVNFELEDINNLSDTEKQRYVDFQESLKQTPTPIDGKPGYGKIAVKALDFLFGVDLLFGAYNAFKDGQGAGAMVARQYELDQVVQQGETITSVFGISLQQKSSTSYAILNPSARASNVNGFYVQSTGSMTHMYAQGSPTFYSFDVKKGELASVKNTYGRYEDLMTWNVNVKVRDFTDSWKVSGEFLLYAYEGSPLKVNPDRIESIPTPAYVPVTTAVNFPDSYRQQINNNSITYVYNNYQNFIGLDPDKIIEVVVPTGDTPPTSTPYNEPIKETDFGDGVPENSEPEPEPPPYSPYPTPDPENDPEDAPDEWSWWKSLDLLKWFMKIIDAIISIPLAIINGIIDLISKLFIPDKPISETFAPLFEQFKAKFNTPEDFAFIAGNFDTTGQSCSIKDIEADLMGKEMKVFDSGALLTTSTWFKPIMSGFMWLLFGFWAFRKVNAIVAKNGGTR